MSSLEPIHALNLDSTQQQAFVKFINSLPEKPPTTVRIFDRNDYYSVHGIDATTAAKEVFSSLSNIKRMGLAPNKQDYLVLSKGNFEILVRKLLLVRRYRVEIYIPEGSVKGSEWRLEYKGSPGCLSQLEEILGDNLGTNEEHAPCLMAVNIKTDSGTKSRVVGVAFVSPSQWELCVSQLSDDELLTGLETLTVQSAPTECIVHSTDGDDYKTLKKIMERANVTITKCKKSDFTTDGLIQDLNRLIKFNKDQANDANAFPETRKEVAMSCLAAALKYMSLMTDESNFGRYRLSASQPSSSMLVDNAALIALHVFPDHQGGVGGVGGAGAPHRSLYVLLDKCRTQHGKRVLAQWLRQPLRDINLINERLDVVEAFVNNSQVRLQLHDDHLRRIPDLQALARRLTRKKANLHDCYKIYQAIKRIPALLQCLSETQSSTVHSSLTEPIAELNEDCDKFLLMIEATLDMEAVDRGEFLVKPSFDEGLQSLREQLDSLQADADKELRRAARDLGLDDKTVKLEINPQTSGFCFRVTMRDEQSLRGNKKYTILSAVKGGVKFSTSALDGISEDYTQAKTNYEREQDKVVAEIVAIAAGYSECLFHLSHIISRVDVLLSFALAAVQAPIQYTRPEVVDNLDEFILKDVRHPCMEVMEGVNYIANDVDFKRGSHILHIVTGPNMGGKSTWMRSCGLAALLAQCGSFVPASFAHIPALRALSARAGAGDCELRGHSTFMTEMLDTAAILRSCDKASLVLVDELGRGTSTYEGCGLAWAIAEELATKKQCFTLFATHYQELTRLAAIHSQYIVSSRCEAAVRDGQLVLLRRITRGAANSLGLQVAAAAQLPDNVLKYAEEKQAQLETNLAIVENSDDTDTSEGQAIIIEFLKQCKQIQESTNSDNEMMEKIRQLKNEVINKNNKYVQALMV